MIKYVPILRGKSGEFGALAQTAAEIKSGLYPLVQILPDTSIRTKKLPDGTKVDNPRTLEEYLQFLVKNIRESWMANAPIMIDRSYIVGEPMMEGTPLMTALIDMLNADGIKAVPVIEFSQSEAYLNEVREMVDAYGNGAAVRLRNVFFNPRVVNVLLDNLLVALDARPNEIDIVIDLQYIQSGNFSHLANSTAILLSELIHLNEWRSIIVCSGSFPKDLASVSADDTTRIDRVESQLWDFIRRDGRHSATLVYGDYCNIHPIFDPSSVAFQSTCSIKYSTATEYVILRGRKAGSHPLGNGQYREKARELVGMNAYSGQDFSFGDHYIHDCANGGGPGAATQWVKATVNHRLALIHSMM